MPKINLKPNSPEFAERQKNSKTRTCDRPGCPAHGVFRAPKDRSLSDHYWFCEDHIAEYNRQWDFFAGMPESEVEKHILKSMYGDRPTWRYDVDGAMYDSLRRKTWQTYHFTEAEPPKDFTRKRDIPATNPLSPEGDALTTMGLEAPVTFQIIKARYKELAKRYHPDFNPGDKDAEELLKKINMAYTILKASYAKFEKLDTTHR